MGSGTKNFFIMATALASTNSNAATASTSEATVNQDEDEPMVTILPQEVIDSLAELDLELSEGKIISKF